MAKVDVVVIGGGKIADAAFREAAGVECKSLIELHGRPMIEWVVQALRDSTTVGRIAVIGPRALRETRLPRMADCLLDEGDHEVENLFKGMDALSESERILMVTGDMPLLSPESIDDLSENAPPADIVYPAVTREAVLAEFPDRKWIFVKTTDGTFTGSSAALFRPAVFRHHEDALRRVFDSRRSVMALVKMWGIGFALKFALGMLALRDAERRISEVLNVAGRAYVSRHVGLAFDVDKASDIGLAEEKLRLREAS
jgi:GTP:adenosylcobinamide-phosphate guanylyltransferase